MYNPNTLWALARIRQQELEQEAERRRQRQQPGDPRPRRGKVRRRLASVRAAFDAQR
jgi:hypothetical protein